MQVHSHHNPLAIAVLISGNGSNLQAIIDAITLGLPARICVVISDQEQAYGLIRAQKANIPTEILSAKKFANRDQYDQALIKLLSSYNPELIVLAGFMRILNPMFVQHFRDRIFNIHPSLLPKYPGLHTYKQALIAKEKIHGATVHLVTDVLDGGPIIAQIACTIDQDETIDSLKNKVQTLEHKLYPEVIRWYASGRLQIQPGVIQLDGKTLPATGLQLDISALANYH